MFNQIVKSACFVVTFLVLAALAAILLLTASPVSAGDFSEITVYNCSNSADGVDVFTYNKSDTSKSFSYDSGSVGKGDHTTFHCIGSDGCQVQYGSLFGDDVWETPGNGDKRYVLSKASGFLGFVATLYVGSDDSVCKK